MAFDETKILEIVAEYIKDNPDSNIKNKIDEIFKLNEPMEFFTAANIMNCIRKSLDLSPQPISATNDFYKRFATMIFHSGMQVTELIPILIFLI